MERGEESVKTNRVATRLNGLREDELQLPDLDHMPHGIGFKTVLSRARVDREHCAAPISQPQVRLDLAATVCPRTLLPPNSVPVRSSRLIASSHRSGSTPGSRHSGVQHTPSVRSPHLRGSALGDISVLHGNVSISRRRRASTLFMGPSMTVTMATFRQPCGPPGYDSLEATPTGANAANGRNSRPRSLLSGSNNRPRTKFSSRS